MKFLLLLAALLAPATASAGQYGPFEEEMVVAPVPAPAEAPAPGALNWERFSATAYEPFCTGCIGITADGTVANPAWNIIAVDRRVIPLGSRVVIRRRDGSCKVYTARDTGGAIKGNKVDILVRSHREAINFGRQQIEVARVGKNQPTAEELRAAGCTSTSPQS